MDIAIFNAQAAILSSSFLNFIQKISLASKDVLDIFVVAVLIFFLLILIRKTRSLPIFLGIILLGIVYVVSIYLNLRLTQSIFNALISVILIILAIVFQKELRRFFEMIGLMGIKRKAAAPEENTIRTICQAIQYFAEHKIGALVVFAGRENIYRHIEGGIILNGRVSLPLLLSIFNTASPGHDGAVIIENNIVRRFAAHLPLAENLDAVRKFGTRHRAALGLAERTDAFSIIVSEEKGTISIARQKSIFPVANAQELAVKLKDFFEKKFPQKNWQSYSKRIKENLLFSVFSILAAFLLWVFFTYQTSVVQRNFTIPLEYKNLPPEYVVDDSDTEEAVTFFSGRESDFKLLDVPDLKISVDLTNLKVGWHRVQINKDAIPHPAGISIVKTDPESIRVHIAKMNP
jgi:uncharacterized protein (TIGR00159 family)